MAVLIRDFMSAPVTSCTIDSNVGKVRDLMTLKGFSALPVVEVVNGHVNIKGIITYRDIAGVYDDNVSVQQVMTQLVRVVLPTTSAKNAADLMLQEAIHHLVIVEESRIVGMVSSADFVHLVSQYDLC